jgi:hypothetical protein
MLSRKSALKEASFRTNLAKKTCFGAKKVVIFRGLCLLISTHGRLMKMFIMFDLNR